MRDATSLSGLRGTSGRAPLLPGTHTNQKEGLASAHLLVGTAGLADEAQVCPWVTDPAANTGVVPRCWYLDTETSTEASVRSPPSWPRTASRTTSNRTGGPTGNCSRFRDEASATARSSLAPGAGATGGTSCSDNTLLDSPPPGGCSHRSAGDDRRPHRQVPVAEVGNCRSRAAVGGPLPPGPRRQAGSPLSMDGAAAVGPGRSPAVLARQRDPADHGGRSAGSGIVTRWWAPGTRRATAECPQCRRSTQAPVPWAAR